MSDIRFVYFDVGQVLVDIDQAIPKLGKILCIDDQTVQKFWDLWGQYTNKMCLDTAVAKELERKATTTLNITFPDNFNWTTFSVDLWKPNKLAHELVKYIEPTISIGILSNAYEGMIAYAQKQKLIPMANWQVIIDSYTVGLIKPDAKIYQFATEKAAVPKESILFIDDNPKNIIAAQQFGWQTIWFEYGKWEAKVNEIKKLLF